MSSERECSNIMFDLVLTAPSGGVTSHYAKMNMNEPGGVPSSWLKYTLIRI